MGPDNCDILDRDCGERRMTQASMEIDALEAQYERTVREDIELFRNQASAWMSGDLTDVS